MNLLWLAADEAALPRATAFLRDGGVMAGLPEARLDVLEIVVEELFVNVAQHSGAAAVELRYSAPAAGVLEVEIADDGQAFDPLTRPAPEFRIPLEARPVGGLGIYLVRRFTQSLRYCRDGGWNRVVFRVEAGGG